MLSGSDTICYDVGKEPKQQQHPIPPIVLARTRTCFVLCVRIRCSYVYIIVSVLLKLLPSLWNQSWSFPAIE